VVSSAAVPGIERPAGSRSLRVLLASARSRTPALRDGIVRHLGGLGGEATAWLVPALRTAAASLSADLLREAGFDAVAADCARRLRDRLARSPRAAGDWSITALAECACGLCEVLTGFLGDPALRVREWPLQERDRRHIHNRIDFAELPVRHETRRQGRPYALVLAKEEKLFATERRARERDEADLQWITPAWA